MNKIEPYNKVWINCNINLIISLLMGIDEKYELYGCENCYEYYAGNDISGGGIPFSYLTVKQMFYKFNMFSDIIELNFDDEKGFKECIIDYLSKKNSYILIHVDLFNWLEGSVSWKKFHWSHYSLLTEYDKKKNTVIAFDELQGEYIKFEVGFPKLYSCLSNNDNFRQLCQITMKEGFSFPKFTKEKLNENASNIIDSLQKMKGIEFWSMCDNDFRARSHMEVNGVYLQRVEGRHEANKRFLELLIKRENGYKSRALRDLANAFVIQAEQWRHIRMELYKIYFDERNRAESLVQLGNYVYKCFQEEIELWNKFISIKQ